MALVSASMIEDLRKAVKVYRKTGSFPDGFVQKPKRKASEDKEASLPKG